MEQNRNTPHSSIRHRTLVIVVFLVAFSAEPSAWAQQSAQLSIPSLPGLVVMSTRLGTSPLSTPASVDVLEGEMMRDSQPQVNLSESLGGVPGLQIQNRQNYAQDLQISVRGFGARSTFGIRGVRLYVDGIPATLPDGQGQSANLDIASIDRIEVLRGPFSALYGNSSGGVILAFTEEGHGTPSLTPRFAFGSNGLRLYGIKANGSTSSDNTGSIGNIGSIDYLVSANNFASEGYRAHSEASKDLVNAKLGIHLDTASKLTVIVNSVDLKAQDPLGLDWAAFKRDPRSVAVVAEQFNTRKTVQQTQGGLIYEHRIDSSNDLRLLAYYGQRQTVQFQAMPLAPQANPRHAGGVIDLRRDYGGLDARWTTRLSLVGQPITLVGGLAWDTLQEQRQGYENFSGTGATQQLGVVGALRRNERNKVWNLDPYVQASWQFASRWTLDAGMRRSAVRFISDDHYIVGINGDDSGAARYQKNLPVAALRWQVNPALNVYATMGRGFETPTFNELSYRSDGAPGLNFTLQPSVNTSAEVGTKLRSSRGMLTAALFQILTTQEIVSAGSTAGRATFRNAGRTQRDGVELAWECEIAKNWQLQSAYTYLNARYRDSFATVPAGNRIPGIARHMAYSSLQWLPQQGWRGGVTARYLEKIYVNDSNSEAAPSYFTAAAHAAYRWQYETSTFDVFVRVDNVFDRQYAGSAIINEGNGRYYEAAPGRNWTAGISAAYRF